MARQLHHILEERFQIPPESIQAIRQNRDEEGTDLAKALLKREIITEDQLLEAQSIRYGIPFWRQLPLEGFNTDYTQHVPIQFLKKFSMVPLLNCGATGLPETDRQDSPRDPLFATGCVIAVNDPSAVQALDDLVRILDLNEYHLILAPKSAITSAINIAYQLNRGSAEELVQNMEEKEQLVIGDLQDTPDLLDDTSEAPIIKLVNNIISQAVKAGASDIHIEPYQDSFKVRHRVDGVMYDLLTPPQWILPALTSRIKVMASLNIAEKRLPQDGRLNVRIGDAEIDVRASTIPTGFGERVVLRLLNKTSSLLSLNQLGLEKEPLHMLQELVRTPNGIILITGPTGSGKTTTLYAILSSINTTDINIITIEDPVEYQIRGISQIQVNPKIDLTFAKGLRSIVRQDPDVILVGEIRDKETADIAVQSALTGHLVFSTLHTNDSASAITRLVDIGVEPFLISSAVVAVLAQRLVRVLCEDCKTAITPDQPALAPLGLSAHQMAEGRFYKTVGCDNCFQTGYRGQIGIFEMMPLKENIKRLILETSDANQIKSEALANNLTTLRQDGIRKVVGGITTIEEVLRVTQK